MNLRKFLPIILIAIISSVAIAQEVTITYQQDGEWKGEIGSNISVTYKSKSTTKVFDGVLTKVSDDWIDVSRKLIWLDDIISISAVSDTTEDEVTVTDNPIEKSTSKKTSTKQIRKETKVGDLPVGFFVLPMEGSVGPSMRSTELKQLVAYIDEEYGSGQIIVLKINSGGGSGWTWSDIRDVIFKARERHRIVAWAEHAISAAAMTAYCCDEIYYTSTGELGSCSGYRGSPDNPLPDEEQQIMINEMEKVMASSSRDPRVTGCLFLQNKLLSYTKDPETNEITYFDTLEGEEELSGYGDNLTLFAQQAIDSGLGDGIADTPEQLAELLNIKDGYEIDDYGRQLFEDWKETSEEFQTKAGPKLLREFFGDVDANSEIDALRKRIKAARELIKWADRLGESAMYLNIGNFALTKERVNYLERQILELEHEVDLLKE